MKINNKQNGNGGYIDLIKEEDKNTDVGRLTYTIVPDEKKLIISYVMVFPEFEGRGMGKFLVEAAIEFARNNGWKIYPHCSYARSVMNRMNDVEDILLQN